MRSIVAVVGSSVIGACYLSVRLQIVRLWSRFDGRYEVMRSDRSRLWESNDKHQHKYKVWHHAVVVGRISLDQGKGIDCSVVGLVCMSFRELFVSAVSLHMALCAIGWKTHPERWGDAVCAPGRRPPRGGYPLLSNNISGRFFFEWNQGGIANWVCG